MGFRRGEKEKGCSLPVIPRGIKKGKIPPLREKRGVWEAGAAPLGTGLGSDTIAPQVNGINVEGLRHSEVVSHIKARDSEARLLVVDPETDEYFKKLGVTPTEEHTKGEAFLSHDSRVGISGARQSHISLLSHPSVVS